MFVKDLTLRQLHYLKLDHSSLLENLVLSSAETTPYASGEEEGGRHEAFGLLLPSLLFTLPPPLLHSSSLSTALLRC